MKLSKLLTFDRVMVILLLLATVFNIAVHSSSPAYAYYKENVQKLSDDVQKFRTEVKDEFVPSIQEIAVNMVVPSSNAVEVAAAEKSTALVPINVDTYGYSRAYASKGQYYERIFINGFEYRIGDCFYGSVIRSASPDSCITDKFIISQYNFDRYERTTR